MAFTAQLGTSSSQAGSIVPGYGSGTGGSTSYNNSLSIDAIAATGSLNVNETYTKSLSIDAVAAVVLLPGKGYPQTLSINATASFSDLISPSFYGTLSIDGIASCSISFLRGYNDNLSISSTASFATMVVETNNGSVTLSSTAAFTAAINGSYHPLPVTISSTASVGLGIIGSYHPPIIISSTASLSFVTGVPSHPTLAISGIASFNLTANQPWQNNITIAGIVSVPTPTFFISLGNAVTISGITSTTEVVWVGAIGTQVITGSSAADVTSTLNTIIPSLFLTSTAYIFPETLYNNLLDVLAVGSVTASEIGTGNLPENPGAMSGMSVSSQALYRRTMLQTLTMAQSIVRKRGAITLNQTFTPIQSIKASRVQGRNVPQTIVFVQDQYPVHPISQHITFAQAIIKKKVYGRIIQQTFNPHLTVNRPGTFGRGISQTLKFNPPRTNLLPIFNGQQVANPYPNIYAGLVTQQCKLILSVPQRSIVLPCPQLNDTQANLSSLNLKRTMTGETYTYIRRAKQNKLRYSFWLTKQKSLELRDFLLAYYAVPVTVINWKGETWIGSIQNSPLELTTEGRWQPVGERVDISLEFDAIKIGG